MKLVASLLFALLGASLPAEPKSAAEYGDRVHYSAGDLCFPDFILRFVGREEHRPPGTNLFGVSYTFEVFDERREKIAVFTFTMSGVYETTRVFEVGGQLFVAEMFYSTAGQPVPRETPPKENGRLTEGEIVVWSEATARVGNRQLLEIWRQKRANQSSEPTPTAGTSAAEQPLVPAAVVAHL